MHIQVVLMTLLLARAQELSVRTDISKAPSAEPFVRETEALVKEWYPRVDAILYGLGHALTYPEVRIIWLPKQQANWAAWVDDGNLFIPVTSLHNRADSYGGMIVHEIAHIAQNYNDTPKISHWIVEGIADYIRHKHFEKDIQTTFRLTQEGRLTGYTESEPFFFMLQQGKIDLRDKGYERRYTVASTFLYWLEQTKNPTIVVKLHKAIANHRYSPEQFKEYCAADLDDLWTQFIAACLRTSRSPARTTERDY